jgi:hypothetical protein
MIFNEAVSSIVPSNGLLRCLREDLSAPFLAFADHSLIGRLEARQIASSDGAGACQPQRKAALPVGAME